jgi:hypothetical protein
MKIVVQTTCGEKGRVSSANIRANGKTPVVVSPTFFLASYSSVAVPVVDVITNERESFIWNHVNKRYCQAGITDQKNSRRYNYEKKGQGYKVVWRHHLDVFVGQFYLSFFLAWAASFGGPCKEKATVKLDNRIVKIVLSKRKKKVRKGKGK